MNRKLNTSSGSQLENNHMDWIRNWILLVVVNSEEWNGMDRELNTPRGIHFERNKMEWIQNWILLLVFMAKKIKSNE